MDIDLFDLVVMIGQGPELHPKLEFSFLCPDVSSERHKMDWRNSGPTPDSLCVLTPLESFPATSSYGYMPFDIEIQYRYLQKDWTHFIHTKGNVGDPVITGNYLTLLPVTVTIQGTGYEYEELIDRMEDHSYRHMWQ